MLNWREDLQIRESLLLSELQIFPERKGKFYIKICHEVIILGKEKHNNSCEILLFSDLKFEHRIAGRWII